ncbi:MAG: acyl-CoA dehydrogenase family protein, partial [Candidatus Binataceae bacterium]
MDFTYSAGDESFRKEFRQWLKGNVKYAPKIRDVFAEEDDNDWNARVAWHKRLNDGGWVAPQWPKEFGGRGCSMLQTVIYHEELDKNGLREPYVGMGISLIGPTLMHWGAPEQKSRYLPKILTGDEIWCQGYSEPNAGSDLASLQTRAVQDGDDFIVNGSKIWTSMAQHADMVFLLVRTDTEAPKHKGISYLLVDMHSPGVTVRPLVQMTGAKGFNQIFFEDVRVPKQNIVGEKNQGWQVAITTLMFERAGSVGDRGAMAEVHELANLAKRIQRNGKTAWGDASVRQKIAEFACDAAA